MQRDRKGVWLFVGVGAAVVTAAGIYFVVRALKKSPRNSNVRRVEAIIKEAEDLIRHHT